MWPLDNLDFLVRGPICPFSSFYIYLSRVWNVNCSVARTSTTANRQVQTDEKTNGDNLIRSFIPNDSSCC